MIRSVLLAALLLAAPAARAQRVPVDPDRLPWSAIVRIQVPGVARCTGFAVAPLRVVTAAHCLYGRALGRFVPAADINVLSDYRNGIFLSHATALSYRVLPGFVPGDEYDAQESDVALLALAVPVTRGVLVPVAAAVGQAAMLGGYSQDRAEILTADADCHVVAQVPDSQGRPLDLHSCAGTFGTSGAPLLVRLANGAWEAGGVQVAGIRGSMGGLAVPAAVVQSLLQAQ